MSTARIIMHATGEVTVVAPFRDRAHGDGQYGFLFPGIDAARDFCALCGLTWAVEARPSDKPAHGGA